MKHKNIDAMREVRLWIGQVIVPGAITFGAVMQIPGVRDAIVNKVNKAKRKTAETKDKVNKAKRKTAETKDKVIKFKKES